MSNVLSEHTRQQVLALGRLGWSLRRIEAATGVRRETASGYLKAAAIPVSGRGGRPRDWPPKPATTAGVSTDLAGLAPPGRAPRASTCEPYRELIIHAEPRAQRHGHLAGLGRRPWVRGALRQCPPLRGHGAGAARRRGPGRHHHGAGGGGPSRLRRGPMVRHPDTGKYRRTRLFVLTLGPARRSGSSSGARVPGSGPSSTCGRSAGWAARCASSSSTT